MIVLANGMITDTPKGPKVVMFKFPVWMNVE